MEINWYPGHMAKAKRLLEDQIKRSDLVIEICDARLPYSSRNPDLDQMLCGQNRVLVMNKADLADESDTSRWLAYFRDQGFIVDALDMRRMKAKNALSTIEHATRAAVDRAAARGFRKTVRATVVGVPNVGKSTYINRLHGSSIAQTGDRPGVTRSTQWVRITPWLELLDTPGLLWPRLNDQVAARRLSYLGTIRDDVLNLDELALSLLNDLAEIIPGRVSERFHVDNPSLRGIQLLDAVCLGRGFLMKGNEPDYERCCRVVLDEFRAGKLGRITLEKPDGRYISDDDKRENGKSSETDGL